MEILYLLIPLSTLLVLLIIAVFGWALHAGQFDDVEREGRRILDPEVPPSDAEPSGRSGDSSSATIQNPRRS
jgi:cbb3-type cytochrome oxidase maturation protein